MPRALVALAALSVGLSGSSGCGETVPSVDPNAQRQVAQRKATREARLAGRQRVRDSEIDLVSEQRRAAGRELRLMARVKGRPARGAPQSRYGSDRTGDPPGWRQAGARATRAPNSDQEAIAAFRRAAAAGRIELVGAAKWEEVDRGLIDSRLLVLLDSLSRSVSITVNSLRISHPRTVQDEIGTPTDSNHIYGRAADISAVGGVSCGRETKGVEYRTLLDNPPPRRPGPCLRLAMLAAGVSGPVAPSEIIYYWRVPGTAGVSLPNHDDHVHVGYRNYPLGGRSGAVDMQLPSAGASHTLEP